MVVSKQKIKVDNKVETIVIMEYRDINGRLLKYEVLTEEYVQKINYEKRPSKNQWPEISRRSAIRR